MAHTTFAEWRARAATLQAEGRAFIDGVWRDAGSGAVFERRSPIDGAVVAEIARCAVEDVDRAAAAARAAYDRGDWRFAPPAERQRVLNAFAELILRDVDHLALCESLETGKPISDMRSVDAPGAAGAVAYYAAALATLSDEVAPTGPEDLALIRRAPLGVIGAIIPWNYPLIIAAWKIAPALALGNSVVLKPSEYASLGALRLGALAQEAGLPDGVLNVAPGYGAEAGAALAAHADVDMIAFTGSTETGRKIMAAAAASNLKRVALELGGKSPQIVFADCPDLDAAAEAIAWSVFYNAGQTCHAGTRLLVERAVADALHAKVAAVAAGMRRGHPLDPETQIGALADPVQHRRVAGYLERAGAEGGEIVFGGDLAPVVEGGVYCAPTLIRDVAQDSRLAQEEVFGPVLASTPFDTEAEALARANDVAFGLAASVWTRDMRRAKRMSDRLVAGTVWINAYDRSSMATPFGGFKQSGFGRDRSLHALEKYCGLKTVWTHYGGAA